jgi:four helix bundle suffix protein
MPGPSDRSNPSDGSDWSDPSDKKPGKGPFFLPHGGYEKLRSYVITEAVYDATVVFCARFIDKASRTHDQMIQAARSGVRNISEGSGAAATSKKMEMKLTNVARASLNDELAKDYKSYLLQNGFRLWHKDSRECLAVRERLKHDVFPNLPAPKSKDQVILTGLAGLADFVKRAEPEFAANALLCAINQAAYLLKRQIESQAKDFKENGGFTERLHAARIQARAEQTGTPQCPLCGKPMCRRTAGKTDRQFWGCPTYPNCKGTREIEG